jgi:hypothetical protein
MAFSDQQQESNLSYFLTEFFEPATQATRSMETLPPLTGDYSSLAMLEAFLWLHLGVKINYFPEDLSRRVVYEYGNKILGAHARAVSDSQLIQRFSPPNQRIFDAEFSGRVQLFAAPEEFPHASDEICGAFQGALVLVSGIVNESDIQELFKMVMLAKPQDWEAATRSSAVVRTKEEVALGIASRQWAREPALKVINFMQAYRSLFADFEALSTKEIQSLFLLKRQLKEIQQWRLDLASGEARFLQITRDVVGITADEIKKRDGRPPADFAEQTLAAVRELLSDWGALLFKSATH